MTERGNPKPGSEAGRQLAALRRTVPGKCEVCGEEFIGTRKKKFCSNRCAQRFYRNRDRGEPT